MKKKKPKLHQPSSTLRLDLACGQTPKEGFEGVDLYAPNAKHKVDLFKFPFPWADDSVDEIYCSHFIEHLPAREVTSDDLALCSTDLLQSFVGRDFLFAFFDECWRILKHDGTMTVIVPCARSNRAFQDPTHRRFIVAEMFAYLWKDWRVANKLDHYRVSCDFISTVVPIIPIELSARHPEVQATKINEAWNSVIDWHATLTARKHG